MPPVIYDVAVSIDGFIRGAGGDISRFAQDGAVVEDYAARLANHTSALWTVAHRTERDREWQLDSRLRDERELRRTVAEEMRKERGV